MSIRNQQERQHPANGNNVEYMASFIKTADDPNAWNDGLHTYHNAYIKTTSNLNGSLGEPYRMAMTSAHFDITDIEHSYWHFQILQTLTFDLKDGTLSLINTDDTYLGASDTVYSSITSLPTFESYKIAISNNDAVAQSQQMSYNRGGGTQDAPLSKFRLGGGAGVLNVEYLKNQFVFVGLKYSAEFVDDYHFIFNNADVSSSRQLYAMTEGFVYGALHSKEEKYNKRNVFTTYNEAMECKNSVCGVYISLYDIINGSIYGVDYNLSSSTNSAGTVTIPIDIIIPFDGLLSTQAFQVYPNCIFGDLGMEFRFSFNGLVHCEVSPEMSLKEHLGNTLNPITGGLSAALYTFDKSYYYTKAFEQVGKYSFYQFITGWNDAYSGEYSKLLTTGPMVMTVNVGNSEVVKAWSDIKGWRITDAAKLQLTEIFRSEPFVIPSQFINYRSFEQKPSSSGLNNTTCSMPLINTTDIYFLFPESPLDRTVFKNIQADNFQISVNSIKYPWQSLSTLGCEFYQHQMTQSDFDDFFAAPDEFEDSLTTPRTCKDLITTSLELEDNTILGVNQTNLTTKLYMPNSDNTLFLPSVKLQRPSSGEPLWFDGITQRYSTIIINASPHKEDNDTSAENHPYFSDSNKCYDMFGIIQDATADNLVGRIPFYTNKCVPICVPLRQTYIIFRLINGGGRDYKNMQYLIDDDFIVGYTDPTRNAVSY